MKVSVNIPLDLSRSLIALCDKQAPQYETLANGLIVKEQLTLECELSDALDLMRWADRHVPGAGKRFELVGKRANAVA